MMLTLVSLVCCGHLSYTYNIFTFHQVSNRAEAIDYSTDYFIDLITDEITDKHGLIVTFLYVNVSIITVRHY